MDAQAIFKVLAASLIDLKVVFWLFSWSNTSIFREGDPAPSGLGWPNLASDIFF